MTHKKITHILLNGTIWATFTYVLVVALAQVPRFAGDTIAMTQSAQALVGCAHSGRFIGCPGTNQYGLLQNIPAIFMIWKGMTLESTITVLGLLNVIAFVVLIVLLWRNFSYGVRHLAILIVLAGPLVGYVSTTFGEMIQTLTFVGFGLALLNKKRSWIIVAGFLAAGTRETAFVPLLLIACGVAARDARSLRNFDWRLLVDAVVGVMTGVASLVLFNYWKFGTWKNLGNLNSLYVTPGLMRKLNSFVAIWISPGGGLAPFWFIGACCSLALVALAVVLGGQSGRLAPIALGGALGANTVSLAMWFAPFGWVAWGPRLMIPTVAVASVVALEMFRSQIVGMLRRPKARNLMATTLGILTTLSAASSYGYMRDPTVMDPFFQPDRVCTKVAIIQEDPSYYFKCLYHGAWKTDPSLWGLGWRGLDLLTWLVVILLLCLSVLATQAFLSPISPEIEDPNSVEGVLQH